MISHDKTQRTCPSPNHTKNCIKLLWVILKRLLKKKCLSKEPNLRSTKSNDCVEKKLYIEASKLLLTASFKQMDDFKELIWTANKGILRSSFKNTATKERWEWTFKFSILQWYYSFSNLLLTSPWCTKIVHYIFISKIIY